MEVYLIYKRVPYDEDIILAIVSSEEKANELINEYKNLYYAGPYKIDDLSDLD